MEEDFRYLWAAYKKQPSGILSFFKEGMAPDEFRDELADVFLNHFNYAWILSANTEKGFMPVGVMFGVDIDTSIMVGSATWFPWSSKRNILESALNFINTLRKESHLIATAEMKDKKYFEHMAKYGVIRRVGTLNQGDPVLSVFESRKPE